MFTFLFYWVTGNKFLFYNSSFCMNHKFWQENWKIALLSFSEQITQKVVNMDRSTNLLFLLFLVIEWQNFYFLITPFHCLYYWKYKFQPPPLRFTKEYYLTIQSNLYLEVTFGTKKNWPYKTGDLLKEVKFRWNFLWQKKKVTFQYRWPNGQVWLYINVGIKVIYPYKGYFLKYNFRLRHSVHLEM
jgi:hypothetical protein